MAKDTGERVVVERRPSRPVSGFRVGALVALQGASGFFRVLRGVAIGGKRVVILETSGRLKRRVVLFALQKVRRVRKAPKGAAVLTFPAMAKERPESAKRTRQREARSEGL